MTSTMYPDTAEGEAPPLVAAPLSGWSLGRLLHGQQPLPQLWQVLLVTRPQLLLLLERLAPAHPDDAGGESSVSSFSPIISCCSLFFLLLFPLIFQLLSPLPPLPPLLFLLLLFIICLLIFFLLPFILCIRHLPMPRSSSFFL